jgi:hypothetical protein
VGDPPYAAVDKTGQCNASAYKGQKPTGAHQSLHVPMVTQGVSGRTG